MYDMHLILCVRNEQTVKSRELSLTGPLSNLARISAYKIVGIVREHAMEISAMVIESPVK